MSNTIILKGGSTTPKNGDLQYKELGYSDEDFGLYIGTKEVDQNNKNIPRKLNATASLDSIFDLLYPVGSVYFTVDETFNPNEAQGWVGTWEDVSGCYLYLGRESIGEMTGDGANPISIEDHNLTNDNLPSHNHSLSQGSASGASAGTPSGSVSVSGSVGSHTHSLSSGTATSAGSHTHTAYYQEDGIQQGTAGTAKSRIIAKEKWGVTNPSTTSSAVAAEAGSHSHNLSGNTGSATPTLSVSGSFSGSKMSNHTHTLSGNTSNTGNNTPVGHEVSLNLPKFTSLAWRRIA